jgi:acetyltransferase-like isoleucine patch superfamily enzyme
VHRDTDAASADGSMASGVAVVVPAHNEESVIGRCLTTLLADAAPDDFRVIVVSNGSSDRTAEVASSATAGWAGRVDVTELSEPSKIKAVREGIRLAAGSAVIVLDADVEVSTATARALAAGLAVPQAVVASPQVLVVTDGASWLVRHFYRAGTALPYVSTGMVGSGVFGLSRAALVELGELPDVTNDDGWVRRSFPADRRIELDEEFTVHAARTTRALVARRARILNGNREITARLGRSDEGANSVSALADALDPRLLLHLVKVARFYSYAHVEPRRRMVAGPGPRMSPTASLRNGERITLGREVLVGGRSSLWAGDSAGRITIGDNALLAPEVFITASNYLTEPGVPVMHQPKREADVTIGSDVWLGARVVVLPGVTIGDGAIVGAGAVVRHSLPAGSIAVGTPARVVAWRDGTPLSERLAP